jgi:hypothetical protein
MLRTGLVIALALLAIPTAAAAAAPATVVLTGCTPQERTASFEARMELVAGAERMRLRYTLEARKPGRRWRRVAWPELSGWRTSDPGTTRFISERTVTQLTGPSHYRALVRFRWLDEDGHTIARATRRSRACWQPDHRPNLKPRELLLEAGGRYLALVANRGRSASGPFDLAVTGLASQVVPSLEPGEERWIEAAGPPCQPGTEVTATVDPLDLVDERSERDNALTVPCP